MSTAEKPSRGGAQTKEHRRVKYTQQSTQTTNHPLTSLLQLPKNSGSEMGSIKKERAMLERRPFGASLVILTPF